MRRTFFTGWAVVTATLMGGQSCAQENHNLADLRVTIERLVQEAEADFRTAGASDVQQEYLACFAWGIGSVYPRFANFDQLFPDLAAYRSEHGFSSDALFEELQATQRALGVENEEVLAIAQEFVSYDIDFERCEDLMIANYAHLRQQADLMERCAEALREDLDFYDNPDIPGGLARCPHASLIEPLPEFVTSYQVYMFEYGARSLVGAELSNGWQIKEAMLTGSGVSRTPNHCGKAVLSVILEDEDGVGNERAFNTVYALTEAEPDQGGRWVVRLPEETTTVAEFCSGVQGDRVGLDDVGEAIPPLERVEMLLLDRDG